MILLLSCLISSLKAARADVLAVCLTQRELDDKCTGSNLTNAWPAHANADSISVLTSEGNFILSMVETSMLAIFFNGPEKKVYAL